METAVCSRGTKAALPQLSTIGLSGFLYNVDRHAAAGQPVFLQERLVRPGSAVMMRETTDVGKGRFICGDTVRIRRKS